MNRWSEAGTWVGEGLRREVFFFPSAGARLYGSVYAAADPVSSLGVVFCNSWGYEANQPAGRLVHQSSLAVAKAGGVAAHFHYPGFGDSQGDLSEATMDGLAVAAIDALGEVGQRYPDTHWVLAGLMLGSSVAALAVGGVEVEHLLLVQPALDPERYFTRLAGASKRALGELPPVEGYAFGYPVPATMLESAPGAAAAVQAALADSEVGGTVVAHPRAGAAAGDLASAGAPDGFESVAAEGPWRSFAQTDHGLNRATIGWLRARVQAAAA